MIIKIFVLQVLYMLNKIYNTLSKTKIDDYIFFYLIDFSQHLFVYFLLSLLGLRIVYRIEELLLEDIDVDKPNIHTSLQKFMEIIAMLAINIIIYIIILFIGKYVPSFASIIYPTMKTNTLITFIEDFIILFILVLGDERLEYHITTLRN